MISESYSIKEFVEAIRNKDYLEIVYLADQEATEAERFSNRLKARNGIQKETSREYANTLKDFIVFLRHGINPSAVIKESDFDLIHSLRKDLLQRICHVNVSC
jgi:hypothetical protein